MVEQVVVLMADELLSFCLTTVISYDRFFVTYFFESFWPSYAENSLLMWPQLLLTQLFSGFHTSVLTKDCFLQVIKNYQEMRQFSKTFDMQIDKSVTGKFDRLVDFLDR